MTTSRETASREWSYPGVHGTRAARAWSADSPDHVVLLAHGYGEHVGRYGHVAAALVADGAAVYAVDHVGHGRSDGERVLVEDFEEVVTDLHALETTAREEHPGLPVALVGHSMGGLIAARYAQRYGSGLVALALSGPLIGTVGPIGELLAMDEIPDVPLDISTLSRDPAVGAAYAADPLIWHGPFKRTTVEAMQRGVAAVQQGPSLGELPLLWQHGEQDQLVPMEGSRVGIAHLRGSTFVERTYPGAQHEIYNETNSTEVLADLVTFLRGALQGTLEGSRQGTR